MRSFELARQLLRREWRSGELTTLIASLIIAVTAVFTISLVTDRLTAAMGRQSAQLIGGDLVISSTRKPEPQWQQQGEQLGLATARIHNFDSVIFAAEEMLLCSVKAVNNSYPLLGKLEIQGFPGDDPRQVEGIPDPGTAWVDVRVLERLKTRVGDSIHFGATTLRIEKILTAEPDQGNGLFQFAPRVLVNEEDLAPAQVVGPGSRIHYQTLFHDNSGSGNIEVLKNRLEPVLGLGHRLIEPGNNDNRASGALLKATQYIRIATLMAIVLAAIAIALSARRYSERHYDVSAMLRCLGAKQSAVVRVYIYQLLLLAIIAISISALLGWLSHLVVLGVLKPLLPMDLPSAGLSPWFAGVGSALLLITGFALPPILRLTATSPLRVLRKDLSPPPLSMWLVYGIAALSQGLLLWLLFTDLTTVLKVIAVLILVLGVIGGAIFLWLRKVGIKHRSKTLLGRGIRNLANHASTSASQVMAFAVTLLLIIVVAQLRTGLLAEWRLQLPDNAPNHFAFNLFPNQVEEFAETVGSEASLNPFYPVVRGRIAAINGNAEAVIAGGDNNRELNFSWTTALAKDNKILEGSWPPAAGEVSVESGYAKRLDLQIGDRISLDVGGDNFDASVSSIRSVVWESFSPNFYLIFSQEQLKNQPTSYLTSFYLPAENRPLLRQLLQQFPSLSLIEVDSILARMQLILRQVSLSVELMMLFVLFSGFAVLFATLQMTAQERAQEGALMRALGASRSYLKKAYLMEFGLIGFSSGVLAVVGAELATAAIYIRVFDLDYRPNMALWVLTPILFAGVVALAGYLGSRKIMATSPATLLNN
jgi:putative ABC transport system permease protein